MPRLPRNLHLVATWHSPDMRFAKNTQQDTSQVQRLPRKMTMDTSEVLRLPRKLQRILQKRRKSIAPATQNDFRHVTKHVWMSPSATPATRNEATRRLKPPKMTPSAELTIGTAIRPSCERLRRVAKGCGRLRTVRQRRANTPSTPRPPEWNGNPCYAFGKKSWLSILSRAASRQRRYPRHALFSAYSLLLVSWSILANMCVCGQRNSFGPFRTCRIQTTSRMQRNIWHENSTSSRIQPSGWRRQSLLRQKKAPPIRQIHYLVTTWSLLGHYSMVKLHASKPLNTFHASGSPASQTTLWNLWLCPARNKLYVPGRACIGVTKRRWLRKFQGVAFARHCWILRNNSKHSKTCQSHLDLHVFHFLSKAYKNSVNPLTQSGSIDLIEWIKCCIDAK